MSVLRKQSRIVTFRVSEEEYEVLTRSCLSSGARSLSDFARAAVVERLQMTGAPKINISSDLTTLGKALNDLDTAMQEASTKIRRLIGPVHSEQKANATDGK